ncbi:MAG: NAD(+) synthase [Oscillospiraceae bacterium]
MSKIVKVFVATNKISMGMPISNAKNIISIITSSENKDVDVCLFSAFALVGAQCGSYLLNRGFLQELDEALEMIKEAVFKTNKAVVLGSYKQNECYIFTKDKFKVVNAGENFVTFYHANAAYTVYTGEIDSLLTAPCFSDVAETLLIPAFIPSFAGRQEEIDNILCTASKLNSNAVFLANGSVGDTSFPYINKPFCEACFNGEMINYKEDFFKEVSFIQQIDADFEKPKRQSYKSSDKACESDESVDIKIARKPYFPQNLKSREKYLDEIFFLSANSLAIRMNNTGIKKLVIGVSGGLDSTLALLICAKALDILNLPRDNITAITMQGFGTSDRTYNNAICLMNKLGCTVKEIPIAQSVLVHFQDIGHDKNVHNLTYENAQARERTQILFDIANSINALVVGTGDLSESSLGFCTFGGDHLASYNVNSCINKTTIRYLTRYLAQTQFLDISDLLMDVVGTPVSPELLPAINSDDISQKTELILGEYELHDFFLYCFLEYNYSPNELLKKSQQTFLGVYDNDYIKSTLQIFLKRFIQSQFKRSCTVDSAIITKNNLSTKSFFIPSDMSSDVLTHFLNI